MNNTSSVTTGGEGGGGREGVRGHILWSSLTTFDCAIVLHRELNAYID